ncbi:hypothetical protein DF223_10715 [Mycetocola zhujimingii]|uniref:Tyr recombinase domain-containing protein n=1 Tax=Mycetocola zhujimingii TaxID=2079792 RepID=A0A2U1TCG3_9MICO|nr:hypothetical protein DF223_10715 [Mycetocola zhujimingii]
MSAAHGLLIGGINSHMGEDARLTITNYTPRMLPSRWTPIAAFVRDVVSLAAPVTPYSAHRLMTVCAHYVDWSVSRAGYPLDARILFRRETIENYTRRAATELSEGTLRNYRSMLLRISEVVLPEHKPVPMTPLNERSSIAPYSEAEEVLLRRWARGQNTAMKERKAMALLALCGGAGLKSIEVAELKRRDVEFDDLGVLVHVTGAAERSVPLLAEWEPWLRVSVEGVDPSDVVFGMPDRSTYRNLVSSFVSTTSGELRPRSDKLRATWLVKHLRWGTPMKALMKAAGISKFENLARYLAYVPELDDATYRARLRVEASR